MFSVTEKQTLRRTVLRYREGAACPSRDSVLVESPLEVIINGVPYAALMCTPGQDVELALGFCLTEGLLAPGEECLVMQQGSSCSGATLHLSIAGGERRVRKILAGRKKALGVSSCGNRSATRTSELLHSLAAPHSFTADFALAPASLHSLQKEAESYQQLFTETGATHFCALYDENLSLTAYAEDVGRHNALDKAAGQTFRSGEAANTRLVLLSSRISYEMVHKAIALHAQLIAGFSAVTSGAISLAEEAGVTLVGFLRNPRCNIYTHPQRLGYQDTPVSAVLPDLSEAIFPQ